MIGVLAVLAAGTGGRWSVSDRFGLFNTQATHAPPSEPVPSANPLTTGPRPSPLDLSWLAPVLWVLLAVAVLVAAFVVWRLLPRRSPKTRRPPLGAAVLGQSAEESAPAVQEGLGAAQHLLDTVTDPTDAVLAAWVALEQAAERSGHPRRPSDTPTEFTVDVLTATPADRSAVTTLLGLYLRARFSGGGVGSDAVAEARRCLDALARSWSVFTTSVLGSAPGSTAGSTGTAPT